MLEGGDLVGFSALTWATNVMHLIQLGLLPVPIDVEVDTLNISSRKLDGVLNKHAFKFKAVFITNLLGLCDDIDKIERMCRRKKIILIEDNCEAIGTIYQNRLLGNYAHGYKLKNQDSYIPNKQEITYYLQFNCQII